MRKILIVVDDPLILDFIKRTLPLEEFLVFESNNEAHAYSTFNLEKPDAVILDLGISNAEELLQRIKSHHIYTPIIILSYPGEAEKRKKAFKQGADEFFCKRCGFMSANEFLAKIRTMLHLREQFEKIRKSEESLKEMTLILKKADEAKTELLQVVAHDLKSPLTSIRGFVDYLINFNINLDQEKRLEFLHIIKEECIRLEDFINKYLSIAAIEKGIVKLNIIPLNISEIVDRCISLNAPMIHKKAINVVKQIPDDIPFIHADKNAVEQIINNLLTNAVKFTPQGGKITIAAQAEKNFVKISVSDTGPGIANEIKEKIFQKFTRGAPPDPHTPQGTGLGLAITQSLVQAHGGKIWFESSPGHGTTFTFTLQMGSQMGSGL